MRLEIALCAVVLTLTLAPDGQAQVGQNMGVVNPNTAGESDLTGLPHLNSALVDGMLERRPFLGIMELDAFLGASLSLEQREELYVQLFLPINLNSASDEEIDMVPGVGDRMAHEFEEYRPYRTLAEFRREMGKYVDDDEVARLEQYVFVPVKLNTASDEDILSIPGIGNRMLHEFKEYRLYRQIEQFRREMGKYVDDDEVRRMERYVTID